MNLTTQVFITEDTNEKECNFEFDVDFLGDIMIYSSHTSFDTSFSSKKHWCLRKVTNSALNCYYFLLIYFSHGYQYFVLRRIIYSNISL